MRSNQSLRDGVNSSVSRAWQLDDFQSSNEKFRRFLSCKMSEVWISALWRWWEISFSRKLGNEVEKLGKSLLEMLTRCYLILPSYESVTKQHSGNVLAGNSGKMRRDWLWEREKRDVLCVEGGSRRKKWLVVRRGESLEKSFWELFRIFFADKKRKVFILWNTQKLLVKALKSFQIFMRFS